VNNCPFCGTPAQPLANFCGACRKPLSRAYGGALKAGSKPTRLPFIFLAIAVAVTAVVLGFLVIRARQDRDARAASEQIERAKPAGPNNNPGGNGPDAKAVADSSPERGAYGLPRNIIGPTGSEAQVISVLKGIRSAEAAYLTETSKSYGTFAELIAHHYLNPVFAGDHPVVSGYSLTLSIQGSVDSRGSLPSFKVNADPVPGTNRRHYYISDSSPIRYYLAAPATDKDPFEDYQ